MRGHLILAAFFLTLASLQVAPAAPAPLGGEADASGHWRRPVNTGLYSAGSALYPEDCAKCHRSQYEDWKGALHGKSTGPGLDAQLNPVSDPQTAISCYYCHAPLAGQNETIADEGGSSVAAHVPNGSFDERLKSSGVNCAACHVREGGVFGPPAPSEAPNGEIKTGHVSVQKGFFEESEFCAACHQLDEGFDFNGTPLVNTFAEWRESGYAKSGITCQRCHMPGRRHLFRGIHDPEMVKGGVKFEVEWSNRGGRASAKLRISNTGAGHYFPTYATPLVVIKGYLVDSKGNVSRGSLKEAEIGRKVTLDLSEEIFDTRIPPLKVYEFDYPVRWPVKGGRLIFEVTVYPDEFYNRFFESAVKGNDPSMKKAELEKALKNTSGSSYLLFKEEIPLDRILPLGAAPATGLSGGRRRPSVAPPR